ncbi:YceI family protein [Bernardetia sp.]|uniref:YceI family protein n=1 Tax=Bernardetia sp. TaxID=1937974 RepID=UPI0025C72A4F|nr:YceI family protein [Bernardetia sp.]
MKRISLFASAILVASSLSFFTSCNNAPKSQEAEVADTVATVDTKEVVVAQKNLTVLPDQSAVTWIGSKPGGQHNGTIGIAEGSNLMVDGGNLVGGVITLDMTDITVLDIENAEDNAKLVGHLKNQDFFAVETYPTSVFTIASVEPVDAATLDIPEGEHSTENPTHKITGNLKMMDTEKAITFYANVTMPSEGEVKASAKFNIDRTEFNVSHMAEGTAKVKDKFINNTVNVGFDITAKASDM